MRKYEELQKLAKNYGYATVKLVREAKRFGRIILREFASYLGTKPENVFAVPHTGDFRTDTEYNDAAFSYHGVNLIFLEPVVMGFSVKVNNINDEGCIWLRSRLEFWVCGEIIEIYAGEQREKFVFELIGDWNFNPLLEALFLQLRAELSTELEVAQHTRRIGFAP